MRTKNTGQKGLLITFEGSEGSGKSTQIDLLMGKIENEGREVIVTREPGGTAIGEEIRHLLKHSSSGKGMTPAAELLLFAASRAQLVREVMLPGLKDGKIILCDRFLDSTTVYQGVARELSADPVNSINRFAAGDLVPDLTIVLDVPAEVGLDRIRHRLSRRGITVSTTSLSYWQPRFPRPRSSPTCSPPPRAPARSPATPPSSSAARPPSAPRPRSRSRSRRSARCRSS